MSKPTREIPCDCGYKKPMCPDCLMVIISKQDKLIVQMRDAAHAYQELATCYRLGKKPTEKLFKRLEAVKATLEAAERGE